jgi:hypothetical protein
LMPTEVFDGSTTTPRQVSVALWSVFLVPT